MQAVMRSVLFPEDEMIIAIDVEDTLKEFGALEIYTSDTGADALEWLRDNMPSVAIVDPVLGAHRVATS